MILLLIISFLGFQLILAFNNNLTVDDYDFLSKLNEYGFLNSIKYWYFSWQGRVGGYFFINIFLWMNTFFNALFFYNLFYLIFFTFSLFLLLEKLRKRAGLQINKLDLLICSMFFYVLFQEFSYDKTLIFWLDASILYYLSIAIGVYVVSLIFSDKRTPFYLVLVLCLSLLAATFLENFSLLFFAVLFTGLAAAIYRPGNLFFNGTKSKFVMALLGCSIGLLILITCPGLKFRQSSFIRIDFISIIKISLNSTYHFYKILLLPELGKILLMTSPFIYWGVMLRKRNFKDLIKRPFLTVVVLLGILTGLICFSFLIMAYGTGGIGQPRTLTPVVFLLTATLSIVFFIFGYYAYISRNLALLMTIAGLGIYFINAGYDYLKLIPESIKYSNSEKNRMEIIDKAKNENQTDTLVLDTLYYNKYVIYRSNELSVDAEGMWNKAVKKAKDLNFEIKAKHAVSYTNDVQ